MPGARSNWGSTRRISNWSTALREAPRSGVSRCGGSAWIRSLDMPRELVAVAPREPVLREYAELPLQPDQIRIRSEFSAPKHGTELGRYRGTSAFNRARYDST